MKRSNTADSITASCLSGHATEVTIWRFVRDLSSQLSDLHKENHAHGEVMLSNVTIEDNRFTLLPPTVNGNSLANDVWQLGACIYQLVTGEVPFGGQGHSGQSAQSPLPVFSTSKASLAMSSLTAKCLAFSEAERISIQVVAAISSQELSRCEQYCADLDHLKYKKPQNRTIRMKTYDFWPEAMMGILLLILLALPQKASAQYNAEMEKLIGLTTKMRDQGKRAHVLQELQNDDKWTLMDELKLDLNECSYNDEVNMFGINDIAAEIAQREKGIINVGGRFKHSADGKHHYSFIEVTALAGTTISYTVHGHQGNQEVAVVPFDPKSQYTAIFYSDDEEHAAQTIIDGISYFTVDVGKQGCYEFEITNSDTRNASFAVITYNPMK